VGREKECAGNTCQTWPREAGRAVLTPLKPELLMCYSGVIKMQPHLGMPEDPSSGNSFGKFRLIQA